MNMSDYYVYLHRKATTGEVFYVGKGKNYRANSAHNRSNHWHNVVSKHGLAVDFVIDGVQEWYAHELETDLIHLYGRQDTGDGLLVNFTYGGEGASGRTYSEETKRKIGNASKGRTPSEDTRKKMSVARVGKPLPDDIRKKIADKNAMRNKSIEQRAKVSLATKGKHVSEETKQKLRDAWVIRKERIKAPQSGQE